MDRLTVENEIRVIMCDKKITLWGKELVCIMAGQHGLRECSYRPAGALIEMEPFPDLPWPDDSR